ncbi:radical SAM family heme chaperone HemW [Cyanothece sp. BG0011]|uniref:radical SAM family heme chaperone HemW n=1 Tax=Cyanothece sp. BG0011 TaxID=2082950 RepID=UPI000D1DE795|nr:radical SAM family heme chaperone HemW [Cyanothece sp. BG0011]
MEILPPFSAYLHIPFCRRRCYYCDFPISVLGDKMDTNQSGSIAEYVEFLCEEIKITPTCHLPLETIFFGGGTPSLLPPRYVEKILLALDEHFGINSDAEISLEMDPGTFTLEQLYSYKKLGVNRFSLGVQSFNDELLEKCGRFHRYKDIEQAINFIHQTNIKNFSLDLISGLPYQNLESWQLSLDQAIKINSTHISCYDLVLEPVTAFGKQYKPGNFPLPKDEDTSMMYKITQYKLTQAGYEHYEISNYAKSGYQCRHNLVYWENQPYYAFGMGAASYTNNQRFTRPKTRKSYYEWVNQLKQSGYNISSPNLNKFDVLLESLMLGLRLKKGINLSEILKQFEKEIVTKIYQTLIPYHQVGLVYFKNINDNFITELNDNTWQNIHRIMLSDPDGFLLSNTILASLFDKLDSTV